MNSFSLNKIKINLLLWLFFYSYSAQSQVLLDSVTLLSASGQISKVVAKPDGNGRVIVSWQAENDTSQIVIVQIFDTSGRALTKQDTVARNFNQFHKIDFDVATNPQGKSMVVWSQWHSPQNKYLIWAQAISAQGDSITSYQLGETIYPYVRASMNSKEETAVFWQSYDQSKFAVVQLISSDFHLVGSPYVSPFDVTLSPHCNPLHLTDSTQYMLGYINDFHSGSDVSGQILRFNDQGERLTDAINGIYNGGPMHAMEVSFRYNRSILSWSMYNNVYLHNVGKGSHLLVINPITELLNPLKLDDTPSDVMQVDQDKDGNVFVSWLAVTGEIKCQFLTSSLEPTDEPLSVWNEQDYKASSLDAWITEKHEGFVVHARNHLTSGTTVITLERFRFHPRYEIEETIIETQPKQLQYLEKILPEQEGYRAFWKDETIISGSTNSGIYTQRIGFDLKAIGVQEQLAYADDLTNPINFDVDNDENGNYYLVRSEPDYYHLDVSNMIYLNTYAADGSSIIKDSVVNEPFDWAHSFADRSPLVASNKNGDVVIAWISEDILKARIFRDGVVSDVITIMECCLFGSDGRNAILRMNDSGKFVLAYRTGYYGLTLRVYDANANLINTVNKEVLKAEDSKFNMEITNQDKIILAWTLYDGSEMKTKVITQLLDGIGEPILDPYVIQEGIDYWIKPALSVNELGEFCVVYANTAFRMIEFTAEGYPRGPHTRVNAFTQASQQPLVYYGLDRDILISWFSYDYYNHTHHSMFLKYFPEGSSRAPDNSIYVEKEVELIKGDTLEINDRKITDAGRFSEFYKTSSGQDSIVTWTVKIINPSPSGLALTEKSDHLQLNWNSVAIPITQYLVYRGVSDDVSQAVLLGTTTSDSYQDFTIEVGTVYYYWVQAMNTFGIISDFSTPVYGSVIILALEDDKEKIAVYPNPTNNRLYISNIPANAATRVIIFDTSGRSQILPFHSDDSSVDLGHLPAGLYHINFYFGNTSVQLKVVKN